MQFQVLNDDDDDWYVIKWLIWSDYCPVYFKEALFVKTEPSGDRRIQGSIQTLPANIVHSHPSDW